MQIVVCVKQVYDPATVKISRSREDFDLRQAAKQLNRADRHAIEQALSLREAAGGEVLAVTIGDAGAEDAVREAVAMGADHGLLVLEEPETRAGDGAAVTRILQATLARLGPVDLIVTGQAGAVDGTGSLAARLAALWNCPLALDAVCLELAGNHTVQAIVVENGGAHAVPLPSPSVVAIAPGPDRPRYPHAAHIANAYQPGLVDIWLVSDLGLDAETFAPETETGGLILGPERTLGQTWGGSLQESVDAVAEILRSKRIL